MATLLIALVVGAALAALWLAVAHSTEVISHQNHASEGCDRACHHCTCSTPPFEGAPPFERTRAEEEFS